MEKEWLHDMPQPNTDGRATETKHRTMDDATGDNTGPSAQNAMAVDGGGRPLRKHIAYKERATVGYQHTTRNKHTNPITRGVA
eukprot:1359555-Lingulodinium_polyedra.AAC.1